MAFELHPEIAPHERRYDFMKYVLDTNVFNRLLDGLFSLDKLPESLQFVATHLQIDEIKNTKNLSRRDSLLEVFVAVGPEMVDTESFVWEVSAWDQCKWSDEKNYVQLDAIKADLDALNNNKVNNWQDALIAEVALINEFTLITDDRHLSQVARKHGIAVIRPMA